MSSVVDRTQDFTDITKDTINNLSDVHILDEAERKIRNSLMTRDQNTSYFAAVTEKGQAIERSDGMHTPIPDKIIRFPSSTLSPTFKTNEHWVGWITSIENNMCVADIQNQDDLDAPLEEISFYIDEIHEDDKHLLGVGAIFYWNIGYFLQKGNRVFGSFLRFRRLPVWREDEIRPQEHTMPLIDLLSEDRKEMLRCILDKSDK